MAKYFKSVTIEVKPLTAADGPFLWEMLYQALYVPQGHPPFPYEILQKSEISRYVQGWGKPDDLGFAALVNEQMVGAVWMRLLTGENKGFGYVDDATPELSIALLPEYRGQGIGSTLMASLLAKVHTRYKAVCLSVAPDNPALHLYQRLGFEAIKTTHAAFTLVKHLRPEDHIEAQV